jgi:hypothetical protein
MPSPEPAEQSTGKKGWALAKKHLPARREPNTPCAAERAPSTEPTRHP